MQNDFLNKQSSEDMVNRIYTLEGRIRGSANDGVRKQFDHKFTTPERKKENQEQPISDDSSQKSNHNLTTSENLENAEKENQGHNGQIITKPDESEVLLRNQQRSPLQLKTELKKRKNSFENSPPNIQKVKILNSSKVLFQDKSDASESSNEHLPLLQKDQKSNKKITQYFCIQKQGQQQKDNQVKSNKITPQKQMTQQIGHTPNITHIFGVERSGCEELNQLKEELQFMQNKIIEGNQLLKDKNQMINQLIEENKQLKEQMKYQDDKIQKKTKETLLKLSIENEKLRRSESKIKFTLKKQRLGEIVLQRDGTKFSEVWVDGIEFRQVKERQLQIQIQKEELEAKKKSLKLTKSKSSTQMGNTNKDTSFTFSNSASLESTQDQIDSQRSITEQKKRISFQIAMLAKEEQSIAEQIESLELEKQQFFKEFKRVTEEEHSRYGKHSLDTSISQWPVLSSQYLILYLLGKGGFSEVYKAFDLDEQREVACKIHQLNPNWTENAKINYVKHAEREAIVHKELNHPNIVRLYDIIKIDDNSFGTVLEYCEGPDLQYYMKKYKNINEKDAKLIIRQILSALKYLNMHKVKVIHYDLKPQNILLHKGEIKISDFGLCKIMQDDLSRTELTSQGVGTYWYLPPECFVVSETPPKISTKVDVWSVGVIFFEMLFGFKPFGNQMSQEKILKEQVILKSTTVNFPQKPVVSNECKDFIKKCLTYNQEDRLDVNDSINHPYFQKK